ncbi:MAG: sigma-54-dependent Fis family transcriptional regulator [Candidatus Omnitrophica bacterium]|nr:sigma-54-dependent Fis family transcriptional regulator [Candidatus Omnitrophota bacterium]
MKTILVVDDEKNVLTSFEKLLTKDGYEVLTSTNGEGAIRIISERDPDLIIMDIRMAGLSGLETLSIIKEKRPKLPVIIMTAYGTTETAIEAMRRGAYEYILKPFDVPKLKVLIEKGLLAGRLMKVKVTCEISNSADSQERIIGSSPRMCDVYKMIGQVVDKDIPVLIRGETGTGKELVARAIYHYSKRVDKPFLVVNCAAIPDTLLESELFGYEKGAFTGAATKRIGRFEQADRGTIFLDEIGDMSILTQAKILRVLQDGTFYRLGGDQMVKVDVRLMTATNRNLEQLISNGEFRDDLYYRLNVVTINMPPLKERLEDIPQLAEYFLQRFTSQSGRNSIAISPEVIKLLMEYDWPGNVRELENCIKRAMTLSKSDVLLLEDIQEINPKGHGEIRRQTEFPALLKKYLKERIESSKGSCYSGVIGEIETLLLVEALNVTNGNISQAANLLGITRPTLREKIERYNIKKSVSVK